MRDLSQALGYCRVSTQRQYTDGHGLERYIERLKQHGLTDEQIYWDIESGTNEKRKGYNKVLAKVRSRQINKIIVPCFDRFTRSALGWEIARQELQEFGVELIFLDGGSLDLETPEGLFTSRILAAMSAQVRDKNKYNSIQGHRFFQEKRKVYKPIFGLKKEGDTVKPNLDLYQNTSVTIATVAIEIIELFLATGNLSRTADTLCNKYGYGRSHTKHLDFPRAPSSLRRWLLNPLLCGQIRYYGEEPEKTIVLDNPQNIGLISKETFHQISQILDRKAPGRRIDQINPIVGLCFCGHCGSKMRKFRLEKLGYSYEYLQCLGAKNRAGVEVICSYKKFYKYEDAIASVIKALIQKASTIAQEVSTEKTIQIPHEVLELQQEIVKLKILDDPDYYSVIIKKEQRLETILCSFESGLTTSSRRYDEYLVVASSAKVWEKIPREELTPIFQDLVARITCTFVDDIPIFDVSFKD